MAPAASTAAAARGLGPRLMAGSAVPVTVMLAALFVIWMLAAIPMNADRVSMQFDRQDVSPTATDFVAATWTLDRAVLPTPIQVGREIVDSTYGVMMSRFRGWDRAVDRLLNHQRSLLFHIRVTLESTLVGFVIGTGLGILLAIGIVHVLTLERSLMPWVIASQTVPILAIAPIIVVLLGNLGLTGTLPKAIISAYLSFFPVTIGMVKGLRAPDPLQLDLMHTYSASRGQTLAKLRWPSSIAFLFPSLKVGIALSLVGAIVAELPTGAQAGIGARLLAGSYYGDMPALWAAIVASALMAMLLIGLVSLAERLVAAARGGRI